MHVAKRRIQPREELFLPAAWSQLLDQLDLVLSRWQALAEPDDSGPRHATRRPTAVRHLKLERRQVLLKIEALGLSESIQIASPGDPLTPPAMRPLDTELHALAQAFEACANAESTLARPALRAWLMNRSQLHHQQAMFLAML